MLDFVMKERPAQVRQWSKGKLNQKEVNIIMKKKRGELSYREMVIRGRIKNETGGLHKHLAPKGARVPSRNPKTSVLLTTKEVRRVC